MATNNPDGTKPTLKYLFHAYFDDGTVIRQTQEDTSTTEPGRSAFFDVLKQVEDGNSLFFFDLVCDRHAYGVDLRNGQFMIDRAPFMTHEEELENFRILYFRVRDTHFNLGADVLGHDIAYRIGWQANVKGTGENVQRWIEIK